MTAEPSPARAAGRRAAAPARSPGAGPPPGAPVYAGGTWRALTASRLAARARRRRHARFFALTGAGPDARIVDIGCGRLGLRALEPGLDITGVDVVDRPDYPGPFVRADATRPLPFADHQFDLAYSSSLIEHLPRAGRRVLAAEMRRIARGYYVQTPAFWFPVEPHSLLPGAHWLPLALRRAYWRLGVAGGDCDIHLLRRRELEALFGPALAERAGPLVKSWIAIAPVTGARAQPAGPGTGRQATGI